MGSCSNRRSFATSLIYSIFGLSSLGLVVWTVIMTGQDQGLLGTKSNVTYVFVDDSKIIDNVNITMSTAKTVKVNVASAEKKVCHVKSF